MAGEWLEEDDLSVYVVGGVPKSFEGDLKALVKDSGGEGHALRLDDELSDWVVSKVQGHNRPNNKRSPTSAALWRAFRALSAARYHLRHDDLRDEIRELRNRVEALWLDTSPLHEQPDA